MWQAKQDLPFNESEFLYLDIPEHHTADNGNTDLANICENAETDKELNFDHYQINHVPNYMLM